MDWTDGTDEDGSENRCILLTTWPSCRHGTLHGTEGKSVKRKGAENAKEVINLISAFTASLRFKTSSAGHIHIADEQERQTKQF